MNNSTDDTNDLESYGVWVKHPTDDANESDNVNLDLPDFEDMFKEDPMSTSDSLDSFTDGADTTLTTDELANITSGFETTEETVPVTNSDDDFGFNLEADFSGTEEATEEQTPDISDFDFESFEGDTSDTEAAVEETPVEEETFNIFDDETPVIDETPDVENSEDEISIEDFNTDDVTSDFTEEVSLDDFMSDDSASEPVAEETTVTESSDEMSEISLDDFMDEGFSDESVASGNNGFEAGKGPSSLSDSEEISLDDFMDFSETESPVPQPKEEEIIDEAPLEMDISFDDSAESIATEDNIAADFDSFAEDEEESTDTVSSDDTVEVSLDDFTSSSSDSDISTEEVDLSDFGIDSDAEETPITQNIDEAKAKESVVDYDLFVGNENTSYAPTVSEIKDKEFEPLEEVSSEPVAKEPTESVSTSLLQQIIADLSGLKNEINQLKSNLEEIKANENKAPVIEKAPEEPVPVVENEIDIDNIAKEETSNDGGFFGSDDTDETIALSFDELDNIMNTADFSSEETVVEETPVEEVTEEPVFEESAEKTEPEVEEDLPSSIPVNDVIEIESDEHSLDNISDIDISSSEDFNFEDTNLEEPSIDSIESIEIETEETDDLPQEISIPKPEDILVESTTADFMDSVTDSSEVMVEEPVIEESLVEDSELSDISFDTVENIDETEETSIEDISVDSIEDFVEDEPLITDSVETTTIEEPVIEEELNVEEPVIEETPVIEESVEIEKELTVDEPVIEETPVIEESVIEDSSLVEEPVVEEPPVEDFSFDSVEDFDTVLDSSEETTTEVAEDNSEEITFDSVDSFDLPEEETASIEETTTDESPVEDFSFDSVDDFDSFESIEETPVVEEQVLEDTVAVEEPVIEDTVVEETPVIEEPIAEESPVVEEPEDDFAFDTVENFDNEEPVVEETSVSEEEIMDTPVIESPVEATDPTLSYQSFDEIDNLNNDITNSNIDYLTSKDDSVPAGDSLNTDLKQDIKSVLLYMDQLLENLPEDKIIEFAKSEEFTTYKKLFNELGLS